MAQQGRLPLASNPGVLSSIPKNCPLNFTHAHMSYLHKSACTDACRHVCTHSCACNTHTHTLRNERTSHSCRGRRVSVVLTHLWKALEKSPQSSDLSLNFPSFLKMVAVHQNSQPFSVWAHDLLLKRMNEPDGMPLARGQPLLWLESLNWSECPVFWEIQWKSRHSKNYGPASFPYSGPWDYWWVP